MGHDQIFRETSVNVISRLTIFVKIGICEWQFPPLIVILSEKLVNFCVISPTIADIMWIGRNWEFTP